MSIDLIVTPENFPFSTVENIIGYSFKDRSVLLKAFTLPSFSNERPQFKNNDDLEFLGDSVLSLIVSDHLYKKGGTAGKFTEEKKKIVSSAPLSFVSEKRGFYKYLVMGKGDAKTFSLKNRKVLENLFEAIVGAIYSDGGLDAAAAFVKENLLSDLDAQNIFVDYVSKLKEYCEKKKISDVRYDSKLISNEPTSFETKLFINGNFVAESFSEGAEINSRQLAAKQALTLIKEGKIK